MLMMMNVFQLDQNIVYRPVSSSFFCAFSCKHRNPKTNGSKVIPQKALCIFFPEHSVRHASTSRSIVDYYVVIQYAVVREEFCITTVKQPATSPELLGYSGGGRHNHRKGNDFSAGAAKIGEKQSRQTNSKCNFLHMYFSKKVYAKPQKLGNFREFLC